MEKMTYEAMSKRYLARGDISPEKLAQRLGEYESTGLEPQEVKELQLRCEAAQAGYDDQKHYAAAYKDKAEELEDKHWEESRQIALYDDQLRKAMQLLESIGEIHRAAIRENCGVKHLTGQLLTEAGKLLRQIKESEFRGKVQDNE